MKSKKRVSFQDEGEKKQKQVSKMKKRKVLKQESQMQNSGGHSNKWKGNPGFRKGPKKTGKGNKAIGEDDSGMKKKKPDWKKNKNKKFKPGKPTPKLSNSKFQKKGGSQVGSGKATTPKQQASDKQAGNVKGEKRKASELSSEEGGSREQQGEKRIKLCEMKPRERKKFRKQKKGGNKVFDMSMAAKKIWEVVRRDDCTDEKKKNLVGELLRLIKGHIKQLIFAHDTVRVIECIVAAGSPEQRDAIFNEVKGDLLSVSKSKYAKFLLIKILNYGNKEQKECVMNSFKGHVVSLVKHSEAATVVETAFNEHANAKQRAAMTQEFYGPTFAVFKDENARNLEDILVKHPEQKAAILNHIKEVLMKITEKTVIRHSIVHHVLREYMAHADQQSRAEVIENIREAVPEILHTKDGARVAMSCVWHGTAKDRKKIVKSMKMHVGKVAKEEHGSLVLISIFDSVDDVKLVQQVIISKLCESFMDLVEDKHARKVLLYMLCPRDSHFFHPDVVSILKAGDSNEHSKKPSELRRQEIRDAASPLLLKQVNEHLESLVKTNATCTFLLGILQHADPGGKRLVLESLCGLLQSPYQQRSGNDLHPLEQPPLHFLIKKLLQSKSSEQEPKDAVSFSVILAECIPEGVMKTWIECNRGAFILLDLLKSRDPTAVRKVLEATTGLHGHLKTKSYKGAELLLAELKNIPLTEKKNVK